MSSVVIPLEQLNRFQRLTTSCNSIHLDKIKSCSQNRRCCLISSIGSTWHCRHPGAPAVIGLTRLYCNREERFLLLDVASEEASKGEELANDGWEIEAEIPI